MAGKITKQKKEKNYTVVPNAFLRRKDLSWKAKGILTYLLSMSDEWEIYKSDLSNRSSDGYDSMISGWKELSDNGYIETKENRDKGLFRGFDYIIHESPILDFPESVLPESENPQLRSTSNKEVTLLRDTKVSNVGLPSSTPTDDKPNYSDRCRLFLDKFNKMRILNGKPSKFRYNNSLCASVKQRLKKYSANEIIDALKACLKDEFHIKSKYKYVTPEYILRENIIEKYLNMNIDEEIKQERGLVH